MPTSKQRDVKRKHRKTVRNLKKNRDESILNKKSTKKATKISSKA